MDQIITVPFGWLLSMLFTWTQNYGYAIIIFAVLVKLIMTPITAKSKKSTMKMSRLTPRIKDIQERYASDPQKQNEMTQALYKEEGVSMGAGCLWSFVPLLILFPLYTVIRSPLQYMLGADAETAQQIVDIIKGVNPDLFTAGSIYDQIVAASHIPEYAQQILAEIPDINQSILAGVNFDFFGLDLGAIADFNVFGWGAYDWGHIGLFLIPLLSAGVQVLSMYIMRKVNDSLVTNKDGIHDAQTAKESQANQSTKYMMWMMPLMSLWIGFSVPSALSLYWFIQGVLTIIIDVILTLRYRKIYDEEDAIRLQLALAREQEEAERERLRAERRAANPDGQTRNTSKKKLQQKQRTEAEAARAAAARDYAARRGIADEETQGSDALSGIPERPYCKGRAYDPNRYAHNPEEAE